MKRDHAGKSVIDKDEWDFSEVTLASERVQFIVSCWEYQREALRTLGINADKLPAPWLGMEEHLRPVPTGSNAAPLKEVAQSGDDSKAKQIRSLAEALESAGQTYPGITSTTPQTTNFLKQYSFQVNWMYSDRQISEAFSIWLRDNRSRVTGRADGKGRPGKAMAQLWDLSVYRLCRINGLSAIAAHNWLLGARGYYRNNSRESDPSQQSSKAKRRAIDLIGETVSVFQKCPLLIGPASRGRFLWSRLKGTDTFNWLDSDD